MDWMVRASLCSRNDFYNKIATTKLVCYYLFMNPF